MQAYMRSRMNSREAVLASHYRHCQRDSEGQFGGRFSTNARNASAV